MEGTFHFQGRSLFLTYPRCEKSPFWLATQLRGAPRVGEKIKGMYIVSEQHKEEDEEGVDLHLHALVILTKKCNWRNFGRELDFEGYHPNIQTARSPKDVLAYIKKDPIEIHQEGDLSSVDSDALAQELLAAPNKAALYQLIYDRGQIHRERFWLNWWEINRNCECEQAEVRPIDSFVNVPDDCLDWLNSDDPRSLVLIGPAGFGKTELARSLGRECGETLWCPERQMLRLVSAHTRCIVFDDCDFDSLSRTNVLNLTDTAQARSFRILYGSAVVGRGVRRIFTSNGLDLLFGNHVGRPELQRRIRVVYISRRLFGEADVEEGGGNAQLFLEQIRK